MAELAELLIFGVAAAPPGTPKYFRWCVGDKPVRWSWVRRLNVGKPSTTVTNSSSTNYPSKGGSLKPYLVAEKFCFCHTEPKRQDWPEPTRNIFAFFRRRETRSLPVNKSDNALFEIYDKYITQRHKNFWKRELRRSENFSRIWNKLFFENFLIVFDFFYGTFDLDFFLRDFLNN